MYTLFIGSVGRAFNFFFFLLVFICYYEVLSIELYISSFVVIFVFYVEVHFFWFCHIIIYFLVLNKCHPEKVAQTWLSYIL